MNNLFEERYAKEIVSRIDNLRPDSQRKWGEMNAAQMLAHCSGFQDLAMGRGAASRSLLGIFVGRFAKPVFYNDKPLPHNMSTIPEIRITGEKDFDNEKERLIDKIKTFQQSGPEACTQRPHPFFGKLSAEEWGKGVYKHLDHHLRQFGV
ncbi:DUF1569 domain-containing protein [Saccharibacillus alkalitolerans]|uniref:DUF1569 domain-containing protein n=1 Tax=Saccharibacillus alkalitolerans TaxID=2705290 RepID=A0ABX0F7J0_9BACL|nr:DUF1569 domain-containing protein [Saccharibacillus alkalitolerans]NGZ76926.1 DUF1569 domain-containing protein [Saccharibacillus alkalitolerans]